MQLVESKIVATVFLLDYGHHYTVDAEKMHALPEFALRLWPQAVQFTIYGILPSTLSFKPDINKFSPE
jgi:hypothetical protein